MEWVFCFPDLWLKPHSKSLIFNDMKHLVIITGGSKGLGRALVEGYLSQGSEVISISRSPSGISHPHFSEWLFDLSKVVEAEQALKQKLARACQGDYNKITLINNAATLGPIQSIQKYDASTTSAGVQLNLTAACMMSAWVLEAASASGAALHIFNVSSGAAHRAIPGWALYCSTKAALDMLSQALALENPQAKIASVNPGIMDTPMQEHIRSASEQDFPLVHQFRHYHKERLLVPPSTIARLLMEADAAGDFASGEILRLEDRFESPRNKK